MVPLDAIRERAVLAVEIRLASSEVRRKTLEDLATVLERYQGDRRVSVVLEVRGETSPVRVRADTARRIRPSDLFVKDVEAVCGAGSVVLKSQVS